MTNKDDLKQQLDDHLRNCGGDYSRMGDKDKEIYDDLKDQIKKIEANEIAEREDITHVPEEEKQKEEETQKTEINSPVPEVPPEPESPYTERRCSRCRKTVKFQGELREQQFCPPCKKIREDGEPILNEHGIQVGKHPPQTF